MRIHALQTGHVTVRHMAGAPRGVETLRRLNQLLGRSGLDAFPVLAYLIEHPEGPILVDTGQSADNPGDESEEAQGPSGRKFTFRLNLQFAAGPDEQLTAQLAKHGLAPHNIPTVVLTHLHHDHAGNIGLFPHAEILLSRIEYEAAIRRAERTNPADPAAALPWPRGLHLSPIDFDAQAIDLGHRFPTGELSDRVSNPVNELPNSQKVTSETADSSNRKSKIENRKWRCYPLTQADDVWLVPTPGHTRGHISVIAHDRATDRWYVITGDAAFSQQTLLTGALAGIPQDPRQARESQAAILEFSRSHSTTILTAHDPAAPSALTNV